MPVSIPTSSGTRWRKRWSFPAWRTRTRASPPTSANSSTGPMPAERRCSWSSTRPRTWPPCSWTRSTAWRRAGLEAGRGKVNVINILLVGQPAIDALLRRREPRGGADDRVAVRAHLGPLHPAGGRRTSRSGSGWPEPIASCSRPTAIRDIATAAGRRAPPHQPDMRLRAAGRVPAQRTRGVRGHRRGGAERLRPGRRRRRGSGATPSRDECVRRIAYAAALTLAIGAGRGRLSRRRREQRPRGPAPDDGKSVAGVPSAPQGAPAPVAGPPAGRADDHHAIARGSSTGSGRGGAGGRRWGACRSSRQWVLHARMSRRSPEDPDPGDPSRPAPARADHDRRTGGEPGQSQNSGGEHRPRSRGGSGPSRNRRRARSTDGERIGGVRRSRGDHQLAAPGTPPRGRALSQPARRSRAPWQRERAWRP